LSDGPRPEALFTIAEAAAYLGVSRSTLRRWTRENRLSCIRVGRRGDRRFEKAELDRFITREHPGARKLKGQGTDTGGEGGDGDGALPRHMCTHHRDRAELYRLFRPFLEHHRRRAAPLLWIHAEDAGPDVRARLRRDGWNVEDLEARDLLRLRRPSQTYLRTGRFAAPRMIDLLESVLLDFRSMGHRTALVAGELVWAADRPDGVEELVPYEAMIQGLLDRYPGATVVCHYDMERLGAEVHLGALVTHPYVQLPDRRVRGFVP
jgi:excisionase family DNA binding protein